MLGSVAAAARKLASVLAAFIIWHGGLAPAVASDPAVEAGSRLTIIVPGTSGGGWDLTAQAMKRALVEEGLVKRVDIVRYPGAGGLVGVSQFVSRHRGDGNILMVGGLVMLGAGIRDEAAVTIRDVVPIARLAGEWGVIAVPAASSLRDVRHLSQVMTTQPDQLRWAGGALGGPDQGLVWSIARTLRIPVEDVPYYGHPGGRRTAESLVEARHNVGSGGYAEFAPFVQSGQLRILGVAGPHRIKGVDAPTLRERGLDISIMNWRAVFAAPDISEAQRGRLAAIVERLAGTSSWKRELAKHRWSDTYLAADPFSQFLDREQKRWPELLNPPMNGAATPVDDYVESAALLGAKVAVGGCGLTLLILIATRRQKRRVQAEARALEDRCQQLTSQMAEQPSATMKLIRETIFQDFGEWNLSTAEQDIAWFMLRGLPMKEIAGVRGTSERTVRQQAQAIYRKAGLEGRSDFAGRVLERFI